LMHYNTYNAYQNAVVSAAYIKDIMLKNKAQMNFTEGPNGIEFPSEQALMQGATVTYINYNVGPKDAKLLLNAVNNGNAGMPVSSLGFEPITIRNNPSLYVGKTAGQAVQTIANKLNINVDGLVAVGKGVSPEDQPVATSTTPNVSAVTPDGSNNTSFASVDPIALGNLQSRVHLSPYTSWLNTRNTSPEQPFTLTNEPKPLGQPDLAGKDATLTTGNKTASTDSGTLGAGTALKPNMSPSPNPFPSLTPSPGLFS
jgi:hypothetical protein